MPCAGLTSSSLRPISLLRLQRPQIPSGCLPHFWRRPSHGKVPAFVWRSLLRAFHEIVLSRNQSPIALRPSPSLVRKSAVQVEVTGVLRVSCEVDHALALSPSGSTLPSGSSSPSLSHPTYLARWLSGCIQTEGGGGPPPSPPRALQTVPSSTCLLHTAVVLLAEIPPPPSLLCFG